MKRDRREWFANPWDRTGMVYVFSESRGNETRMEPVEWDGTGLVFISIPVSLSNGLFEKVSFQTAFEGVVESS